MNYIICCIGDNFTVWCITIIIILVLFARQLATDLKVTYSGENGKVLIQDVSLQQCEAKASMFIERILNTVIKYCL